MNAIRQAEPDDLEIVAAWLRDAEDCAVWAGSRVSFPVDVRELPRAIQWEQSEAWSLTRLDHVVAFGQVVPKARRRMHLARLIVAPELRGSGLGRVLAKHLLEAALARRPAVVSLNASPHNEPALNLYRSLGFALASRPSDEPESQSLYLERAM